MNKDKMQNNLYQKFPVVLFLALICQMLWGSAFPCIKLGYRFFRIESSDMASQILFAGIRFTIAGMLGAIFVSLKKGHPVFPKGKNTFFRIIVLSCFQTVVQYLFFYMGLAKTSGVKGSIIEGSGVFFCILTSSVLFRLERLTVAKLAGSLVGFAGIVLINLKGLKLSLNPGDSFIFISTVSYAFSYVFVKIFSEKDDAVMLSVYQFFFGGLVLMAAGFCLGGKIACVTAGGVALLFYLSFLSAAAYSLWVTLLAHNPVSRISVFGFLTPVFGVMLSAFLLGEGDQVIGSQTLLALLLVCLGIFLVNFDFRTRGQKYDC